MRKLSPKEATRLWKIRYNSPEEENTINGLIEAVSYNPPFLEAWIDDEGEIFLTTTPEGARLNTSPDYKPASSHPYQLRCLSLMEADRRLRKQVTQGSERVKGEGIFKLMWMTPPKLWVWEVVGGEQDGALISDVPVIV